MRRSGCARNWPAPPSATSAGLFRQEEPTLREADLKNEQKDDVQVVEDDRHEPPVGLFRVDVKTRKGTRLTDNRDRIEQLALSRDGCPAVAVHIRGLRSRYDTPPSR
jgi:hypothetical protein